MLNKFVFCLILLGTLTAVVGASAVYSLLVVPAGNTAITVSIPGWIAYTGMVAGEYFFPRVLPVLGMILMVAVYRFGVQRGRA